MTTPNFASILAESPDHVERPKPLPVGTYLCTVGTPEIGESSKKKTPFLRFPLKPLAPMQDVDEEALAEVGGLENKNLSITFYVTADAAFMLDDFHANCGVDLSDGLTRADRNEEVINAQVLAVVTHRTDDNDPSRVYVEVRRTAKAE